jgi:hypothetical protein
MMTTRIRVREEFAVKFETIVTRHLTVYPMVSLAASGIYRTKDTIPVQFVSMMCLETEYTHHSPIDCPTDGPVCQTGSYTHQDTNTDRLNMPLSDDKKPAHIDSEA